MSTRRPRAKSTSITQAPPRPSDKISDTVNSNLWIYSSGLFIFLAIASYSLWGVNLNVTSASVSNKPITATPSEPPPNIGEIDPAKKVFMALSPTVFTVFNNSAGSQGSGVFISNKGIGVTNDHVVKNSAFVKIKTQSGEVYIAKVLLTDRQRDLAILDIGANVSCASISSIPVQKWQTVYALGSPLGMEQTFTNGIVSGQRSKFNLLHTALIAPGSSGSALVDSQGKLIGINKGILPRFTAMSIATPIQELQTLYPNFECK